MDRKEDRLCHQVVHGWIGLLLVLISMLLMATMQTLIDDNLQLLRLDPGASGLRMMIVFTAIYALLPMFTHLIHASKLRPLRWVIVVLGVLFCLFFISHHAGHWQFGERPDFNSHILDLTHHVVAVWLIVTAVRWARCSPPREA